MFSHGRNAVPDFSLVCAGRFGFFAEAQALFLSSCNPEAALDMHCDLHEWDQVCGPSGTRERVRFF